MYIARIQIQNFRCFRDTTVEFQPGVNIIVGENNAGKTALLKALALVFGRSGTLGRYDFHQRIADASAPPFITVIVTLASSPSVTLDDKALVASWLTVLSTEKWEATLTYRFYLPEAQHADFHELCSRMSYWEAVDEKLPAYVSRIYGGKPEAALRADPDALAKFDYHFLDAIRDVEAKMFLGHSPMLKRVLRNALDAGKEKKEKDFLRGLFQKNAAPLIASVRDRIDLTRALELARVTGASGGGVPTIDGTISENDLLSALRLMITGQHDQPLPVSHNGLGYNNLLYIAFVLAHLESSTSPSEGDNAKIFPILVIEEPEAHLHPALQYRLLKYIRTRVGVHEGVSQASRQVFITTHSSHITAAAGLDALLCMTAAEHGGEPRVAYPGRVFGNTSEGRDSKNYIERFLDATKSSMLFAKGVIFVEGTTEQLLLPVLAEYVNSPLEDALVATVGVGGSTAKHFLPLFGACPPEVRKYALSDRKVACLIDADPTRSSSPDLSGRRAFRSCFPYEHHVANSIDYKSKSPACEAVLEMEKLASSNIRVFVGKKTLEYDLALVNRSDLLVTQSCHHSDALRAFLETPDSSASTNTFIVAEDVEKALQHEELSVGSAEYPRFATYYLLCVKDKGAHALELAHRLRENMERKPSEAASFVVPSHIQDAILWACGKLQLTASKTE